MATSGSYDYTTTRQFIITEAFRKIGGLGDDETLDSTRLSIGEGIFNPMVKALAAKGMPVWAREKVTIPFSTWTTAVPNISVGPSGTHSLSYKPLKLLEAYYLNNTSGYSVPMLMLTQNEYEALTNKTQEGTPVQCFFQPKAYTANLYLWLVPDSSWRTNGSFVGVFHRPFQDMDSASDEPDFPAEWHEALIYQLAVRLAPNYGLAVNDRMQLRADAKEALDSALGFDQEEGSIFISPRKS